MAYRVPQKTTKKNEYFCLKCEHLETENYVKTKSGCLIKCKAPNKCFQGEFNAKFYYCREYKSFSEFDPCKICQYKQDYKQKEQECETLKSENFTFEELVKYQDEQLEPFNGRYFEHLDTKMIADLAKKSIRLTTENRKLKNALDEIEEFCIVYSDSQDAYETVYKYILDIINKAKEQ